MPSSPRNRIGEVYGKLTVIRTSERRTKAGNVYWWCRCSCGAEREVSNDKLSLNTARRKPTVNACENCARELQIEGVYRKNDRDEKRRRKEAIEAKLKLEGQIPESWLKLPLTDAHARELGQKIFFRGTTCLRGHIAPYRINGGCQACFRQAPSAADSPSTKPRES